jgi:hypothetical protein
LTNHAIHRILIDNGSFTDILYWPVFQQMGINRDRNKPFGSPLMGFDGEQVYPMGIISLPLTARTGPEGFHRNGRLLGGRPTFSLQRNHWSTWVKQVEGCNLQPITS